MRYTLIGASLRGELLEPHPSVLRQRISSALSGNAAPSAPRAREPWRDRWTRPLLGLGIAATVAVVAIGTLRSLNEASLPTGGAVRFSSPLGVYDFVVRTSVIRYERAALERHARAITDFARAEGLEAHARAVEARLRG